MIDPVTQSAVQSELDSGEQLIWTARPNPQRVAMRQLPLFLFGIPFFAFAVTWMGGAFFMTRLVSGAAPGLGPTSFFPLFGVPFVLVGLYLLTSPAVAYWKAGKTIYAVTNRRAILIEGGTSRSVQTFERGEIGHIERREHSNGTGDVIFARERVSGAKGRSYLREVGFWGIPNAREVERLMRQLNTNSNP